MLATVIAMMVAAQVPEGASYLCQATGAVGFVQSDEADRGTIFDRDGLIWIFRPLRLDDLEARYTDPNDESHHTYGMFRTGTDRPVLNCEERDVGLFCGIGTVTAQFIASTNRFVITNSTEWAFDRGQANLDMALIRGECTRL